ncbi:hypothetical protein BLOT_015204 [Blomia tropicalis]|nr:hypothetical protein BLOT_015204 [Blomia tropicalis]
MDLYQQTPNVEHLTINGHIRVLVTSYRYFFWGWNINFVQDLNLILLGNMFLLVRSYTLDTSISMLASLKCNIPKYTMHLVDHIYNNQ